MNHDLVIEEARATQKVRNLLLGQVSVSLLIQPAVRRLHEVSPVRLNAFVAVQISVLLTNELNVVDDVALRLPEAKKL